MDIGVDMLIGLEKVFFAFADVDTLILDLLQ